MKITKIGGNVLQMHDSPTTRNYELKTLHLSDVHFDSKYCDRELLKKHLTENREKGGYTFIYGDIFDVMGCERDPRAKHSDIRPEYLTNGSYLDLIVEDAYEFFKDFPNIIMMSHGNHETNIMKRHDTDVLDRLCYLLRKHGNKTERLGYSGYIWIVINRHASAKIAFHHGYGGNAPRSKGILRSQMDSLTFSDADVIVSGHDHNKLHDNNVSYYLSNKGIIKYKKRDWLKLGSYKRNSINPLEGGWEVEKGFMPKDIGGYCIDFYFKNSNKKNTPIELSKKIYEA